MLDYIKLDVQLMTGQENPQQFSENLGSPMSRGDFLRQAAGIAISFSALGILPESAQAKLLNSVDAKIRPKPLEAYQAAPKGVEIIHPGQDLREAYQSLGLLSKRWDGVLVLQPPKEYSVVGFATSPSSYAYEVGNGLSVIGPVIEDTTKPVRDLAVVCPRPGIERLRVKTTAGGYEYRDYAVIVTTNPLNHQQDYGFLDIKFAQDMGALHSYAFRGQQPKPTPYPKTEQQADPPQLAWDWVDYGGDWTDGEGNGQLLSMWLPQVGAPAARQYKLVPSKIIPHA